MYFLLQLKTERKSITIMNCGLSTTVCIWKHIVQPASRVEFHKQGGTEGTEDQRRLKAKTSLNASINKRFTLTVAFYDSQRQNPMF